MAKTSARSRQALLGVASVPIRRLLRERDADGLHTVAGRVAGPCRPQPQPTSSSRSPAAAASFSNTSEYLLSCASSAFRPGFRVEGARVGHRRAKQPTVETCLTRREVVVDCVGIHGFGLCRTPSAITATAAAPPREVRGDRQCAGLHPQCRSSDDVASTRGERRLKAILSASALSNSYGSRGARPCVFRRRRHRRRAAKPVRQGAVAR